MNRRRLALIQALVSLVALAAVVWWASHQEAPELPSGGRAWAWLGAALVLYAVATLLRGERWHWILAVTGVRTHRSDCYALTTVGYMGNNGLPARAGEALTVVLLSGRCEASKRTILGSVVSERLLDLIALAVIFAVVVYAKLSSTALPTDRPYLVLGRDRRGRGPARLPRALVHAQPPRHRARARLAAPDGRLAARAALAGRRGAAARHVRPVVLRGCRVSGRGPLG
jgi:hypothetical protein